MRRILLRWHRWVGLYVSLFAILLALTGLLLNHTETFKLDEKPIRSTMILKWYGLEPEQLSQQQHYPFSAGRVTYITPDVLVNDSKVAECSTPPNTVLEHQNELLVICQEKILLLTLSGELAEIIDSSYGLPVPIDAAVINDEGVLLRSGQLFFRLDPASGTIFPGDYQNAFNTDVPIDDLNSANSTSAMAHSIHWERLLLDLHSGRLFGQWGVWLFDIAALCIIFLALSGVWNWLQLRKKTRYK